MEIKGNSIFFFFFLSHQGRSIFIASYHYPSESFLGLLTGIWQGLLTQRIFLLLFYYYCCLEMNYQGCPL